MSNRVYQILQELGLETDDIPNMNKKEAIFLCGAEREGFEKPQKGPCGKSMYTSEARCKTAIRSRLRSGVGGTSFLRTYLCPICHAWHMTSAHNAKNK